MTPMWEVDQVYNFTNYLIKTYDVVNQEISIGITNLHASVSATL